MTDDGGVLGNLPHSRPGKRSSKREPGGRPATSAGDAAAKAEVAGSASPGAGQRPERLQPEPAGDAVTAAVRTAAGLAFTGARVAGALTQELLRRLPRP